MKLFNLGSGVASAAFDVGLPSFARLSPNVATDKLVTTVLREVKST